MKYFFYIENVSDQIYIFLDADQGEELFYQQIKDLKGIPKVCETDTVVEVFVFLLQEPDHCYVVPPAQVIIIFLPSVVFNLEEDPVEQSGFVAVH